MMASCSNCGATFYRNPDETWKTRCLSCWKRDKRNPASAHVGKDETVARLQVEVAMLKLKLAERQPERIPPEMLARLIRLTHPDKHGNSPAANEATQWLLQQRKVGH